VLLDLVMPGIDGREVLATIKADEQLRATPVIMISGRQDMDQIIDCIQVGADDYLLKPVNSVLLSARIKSGLERKRWHDKEENYRIQLEKRERFIRQTFGRYISDSIVEEILEKPEGLKLGGDLRNVTLMMSDIRSFTTLVEHLPPEQVVTILNRYLGRMTDIILKNGGTIDEFLGDAVLAAFGAPSVSEQHAMQAVTCAIEMQAAMASINSENRADGLPELEMAIALNTGEVVAGNIGSERRSKYGFVGHEVNVTSRIEDHAAPNEILVSEKTLQSIEAHHFSVGDSRIVKAKGMEGMLTVYPIKGVADNE
jgi:adenylate cyclase